MAALHPRRPTGLKTYAMVELMQSSWPPRSRLYSIALCGLGTPLVEGLTSYTARLAQVHGLTLRQLVGGEIWPLFDIPNPQTGSANFAASVCKDDARAISGTQSWASQWVNALETLTRRTDLCCATMLPWAKVISRFDLLRPERAWCPACYQAWREANETLYDPLLWSVSEVGYCTLHEQRLHWQCPNPRCQRSQPYLANRMQLGHCTYCGVWLGSAWLIDPRGLTSMKAQERSWQTWVADAVGELLAGAATLKVLPSPNRIRYAMKVSLQQLTGGRMDQLARRIGRHVSTLSTLLAGEYPPRLETLLRLSYMGGVRPLQFLTQTPLKLNPLRHSASKPLFQLRPVKIAQHNNEAYLRALETTLKRQDSDPPSMREMGRRLGCDPHHLYRRFPKHCKLISKRYLAFRTQKRQEREGRLQAKIYTAVRTLYQQGEFPTRSRVKLFLNRAIFFGTDQVAYAAWQEAIHSLGVTRPFTPNNY